MGWSVGCGVSDERCLFVRSANCIGSANPMKRRSVFRGDVNTVVASGIITRVCCPPLPCRLEC